jgi:hypothetical protein
MILEHQNLSGKCGVNGTTPFSACFSLHGAGKNFFLGEMKV